MNDRESFASSLVSLYSMHPFSVTSWIRTKAHNQAVGGKANSQHLEFLAVDVKLDPGSDKAAFLAAVHSLDLHYLEESDHIHVQFRAASSAPGV